jgi:thymidylate kinase
MTTKRLVILEGPDRSGKSSQASLLVDWFGKTSSSVKFMRQPSDDNSLGFLRDIVKGDSHSLTSFERQLLHTCSHIVDAHRDHEIIIMDRCYISALVYGSLTGMTLQQYELIEKIHQSVYSALYADREVDIVLFNRMTPLTDKDDSFYENQVRWDDLRKFYRDLFSSYMEVNKNFVSPFETKHIFTPVGDKLEVFNTLTGLLNKDRGL